MSKQVHVRVRIDVHTGEKIIQFEHVGKQFNCQLEPCVSNRYE